MEAPHGHTVPQPVANISAFDNGRNQTISHANILNSQGNITFINWNPPAKSNLLDKLLKALSDFVKPAKLSTPPATELLRNIDNSANEVNLPEEHYDCRTVSSEEYNIHLIRSHEGRFLPDTISQAPVSRSNYIKSLFPLGYGYPLWFPQPDRNLPMQYHRHGISVGDVGIIGSDGTFDFLFNIWLPKNHPINPNDLPLYFHTIARPHRKTASHTSFNPGQSTISNLDVTSRLDSNTREILITCKDPGQGAIIAVPDGASEEDLKNEQDLMEYISQSAVSWYEYARRFGKKVDRHSLYVVTGCMKAKTWGIATFDKTVPERNSSLVMERVTNTIPGGTSYIWKHSGEATTFRTGPTWYTGLIPTTLELEPSGHTENQCLFIRGFKIALSGLGQNHGIYKPSNRKSQVYNHASSMGTNKILPSLESTRAAANTGELTCQPSSARVITRSEFSEFDRATKYRVENAPFRITDSSEHRLTTSNFNIPSRPSLLRLIAESSTPRSSRNLEATYNATHPSDALNDLLLSKVPGARIAITHDNIWNELRGCRTAEQINKAIGDKQTNVLVSASGSTSTS